MSPGSSRHESREMGKGADIGFLHDVLGFGIVAHNAPGEAIEALIVRLHDAAEGVAVARCRSRDHVEIGGMEAVRIRSLQALGHGFSPHLTDWMAARGKGSQIHGIVLGTWFSTYGRHVAAGGQISSGL